MRYLNPSLRVHDYSIDKRNAIFGVLNEALELLGQLGEIFCPEMWFE